ncbi:shikimate dehydrogenase [PVC group bacterium (ex Bugula neritina AB1)]|nr:shikimate dehydrogenase [PVC group bacterium (ex Bugula neritina AB1)]
MTKKVEKDIKKMAVIGHPIAHSLSPSMHNAAFDHLGHSFKYEAVDISPGNLLLSLKDGGLLHEYQGFNVTIPYKEIIFKELGDRVTPEASFVKAVNTVVKKEGSWYGHNTDLAGFLNPISEAKTLSHVMILGSGGAARAVAFALAKVLKIENLYFVARNKEAVARIVKDLKETCPHTKCEAVQAEQRWIDKVDMIVNTTPVGMKKDDPKFFNYEYIKKTTICYDLIYWPEKTDFLLHAEKKGCPHWNGLEMLLWQGIYAWDFWFGEKPPVDIMRTALEKELQKRNMGVV